MIPFRKCRIMKTKRYPSYENANQIGWHAQSESDGRVIADSSRNQRSGLSLLEVILALAILAMSIALLAQITKQSTDNGLMAQRLANAQILCESKMAEVLAGAIPLTGTSWVPITDSSIPGNWNYQIQTITGQRKDMIGVRLSVSDNPDSTTESPELFFIMRWMIDPSLALDTLPAPSTTSSGTSSSGSAAGAAGGVK